MRHVASTQMNDTSSRSHSVFTIKIEQKISTTLAGGMQRDQLIKAKLNLVDLAGSERASKTGAAGATLKEGANINKSLMTLGNVINALSAGLKKGQVIPYRESQLTRLLQESLGGNAQTLMVAAISPADYNYSETLSTLKYANRARSIANAVKRNEDASERMVRDLQAQIEALKAQLQSGGVGAADPELVNKLKAMEQSQQDAWAERQRLSQQLEEERQQNMNNVISQMMQNVKEQKVIHMKNIKRLTNEKAVVTKNLKDEKDESTALKELLDKNIARYQQLQSQFDQFSLMEGDELKDENGNAMSAEARKEHEKQAENLANEMIPLLTSIEQDRQKFTEKKQKMNLLKTRLQKIEEEITDERAELVATAGVLNQNDKIREQIQQEERLKLQSEFDRELQVKKEELEREKLEVRETISMELDTKMKKMHAEALMSKSLMKIEKAKNAELNSRFKELKSDYETLEAKFADTEVANEEAMKRIDEMNSELANREDVIASLTKELQSRNEEIENLRRESLEMTNRMKEEHKAMVEESKYEMFKKMMDTWNEERKLMEMKHNQTQKLLVQATKVRQHSLR